jgi:hypothetical protein
MKGSDSVNSLTALNPDLENQIQQEDFLPCFICLDEMNDRQEPLVPSSMLRTCGCAFKVHPACWNEWMKEKSDYDCPICRKKALTLGKPPTPPIPAEAFQEHTQRNYRKCFFYGFLVALFLSGASFMIWQMEHE